MTLPYALGCPSCPHREVVSTEDPAATMDELYGHLFDKHAGYDQATAYELLAKAQELTEEQVVAR